MKYHILIPLLVLFILTGCSNVDLSHPTSTVIPTKPVIPIEQPAQTIETPQQNPANSEVPLSNDNYYINSKGNEVHSPALAPSRPSGASARCADGTYSFSQSRRGTCSHHGGVVEWY